jgi:hypothetical protein
VQSERPREKGEKGENMSSREALFKAVEEVSRARSIGDDYELLKCQEWALTWAEREMMKTERGEDWTL